MKTETALTIAGSDSGGGAGIQADLKTFSALEVHGVCAITSLTAQNTQGVEGIQDTPPDFVGKQIDALARDFEIDWAKTGMLSSPDIIRVVEEKVREHGIRLVVDPVMVAASGSPLLEEGAFKEMKGFLEGAELVTPNVMEAEVLSDVKIGAPEDMKAAAERISELGADSVLIKGGHLDTPDVLNLLLHDREFFELEYPRVDVPEVHGTGCTFSAAITAELAKGSGIPSAVQKAGDFMVEAVRGRLSNGKGVDIVNPMVRMWKVTSDGEEVEQVQRAARELSGAPEFSSLIPEVGTNVAMAREGAEGPEDVIGLTGRIVEVGGRPQMTGVPAPGGSEHVANFVMTAMSHDPEVRAGMNVRFSEDILEGFRDMGLSVSSFDREEEPPGVKTMNWGTERAIEGHGGVPDVIYDRGDVGKEPMIRLLGKTPIKLSGIALKVARGLEQK